MAEIDFAKELKANSYPGRGIAVGRTEDGKHAAIAYFIMGRSENSRNRIFVEDGEGIRTEAFDPGKLTDPSLIIYAPVRTAGPYHTIVTNGDQTDTIYEGLQEGKSFVEALEGRRFEPDAPNFTPRISALLHVEKGSFDYRMSILKSDDGNEDQCLRFSYQYENPQAGQGHFISTYLKDGSPLPSFEGEPKKIRIPDDIDRWGKEIWGSLNQDNKVALFVRFIDLATSRTESRIYNKHMEKN